MRAFSYIVFSLTLMFTFCSCSSSTDNAIYGTLVDDYSGDSIECIAYTEKYNGELCIYEVFTKFGSVELYDAVPYNDGESDEFTVSNDQHSLGYTLNADLTFTKSRKATQEDYDTLSDYRKIKQTYCVNNDGIEKTLHYSNSKCASNITKQIYVANYTEAALLRAGMCDVCFPEMYDDLPDEQYELNEIDIDSIASKAQSQLNTTPNYTFSSDETETNNSSSRFTVIKKANGEIVSSKETYSSSSSYRTNSTYRTNKRFSSREEAIEYFNSLGIIVDDDAIVYVTDTGEKYHEITCGYLHSSRALTVAEAIAQGYGICSKCNPPFAEFVLDSYVE